ncbi:TIGR00341 family protein [Paucidesulfovibrio longus]|uniref:TIGR00341 family protein n=1 Tax=Paucidesulfovibrio longus TaxID=889 RepID=UPI0003B4ACE5|nr:TIGR00341 family protein [Paucidesulfovibrio longus]
MSLRLVEIIVDNAGKDRIISELDKLKSEEFLSWCTDCENDDKPLRARMLLEAEAAAEVVDRLEKKFSGEKGFRIIIYPVQATIPRLEEPEEEKDESSGGKNSGKNSGEGERKEGVIREELRSNVLEGAQLTFLYALLAALSSIVASIGLLRDAPAVVIGAMVIAPLLGPNVGLSLATVLGDVPLARASLKTLGAGILLVVLPALGLGAILGANPQGVELAARTSVGLSDVALALAAGVAGILSLSQGASTALVGVMVALALVPPLSACGLFLGSGLDAPAGQAGLLALTNVVCLNLAGVVTFALRGVRPLRSSEQKTAKWAILRALAFWAVLLLAVSGVILLNARP